MRELTVMETRFYIRSELDSRMYDALFNINVAKMHGKIDANTAERAEADIRNSFTIARMALDRCETVDELEDVACQLKEHLQKSITLRNLPCKL